jgi:hypothetical protein
MKRPTMNDHDPFWPSKDTAADRVLLAGAPAEVRLARLEDGTPTSSLPRRFAEYRVGGNEWTGGGNAANDTALNILVAFTTPPEAYTYHRAFRAEFLDALPSRGGRLDGARITAWIEARWAARSKRITP